MKDHIKLKIWKKKDGWAARVYILAAVFLRGSRKKALHDLNEIVREMTGCDENCGCKPLGRNR